MYLYQWSIGKRTALIRFFVLATLNPIEMEGTYQLPEAQLDRFLFKVVLDYPSQSELERILAETTSADTPAVRPVLSADDAAARVEELRRLVRRVLVAPGLVRLVDAKFLQFVLHECG